MKIHLSFEQNAAPLLQNPILLAAILTFTGVLLTVIIGAWTNTRLAKKRADFEERLAIRKLEDERLARAEARAIDLRLRNIEFQRSTLVELQEGMLDLVKKIRTKAEADGDQPELTDQIRQLNGRTALLISRLENRELAESADQIKRHFNSGLHTNPDQRNEHHHEGSMKLIEFVRAAGLELRKLASDRIDEAGLIEAGHS